MKFIDEAIIEIKAGDGGSGMLSFSKENNFFKIPNGGNGGNGGNVFAIANRNLNTLSYYRYQRQFFAKNGKNGLSSFKYGSSSKDMLLHFPIGTIISKKKNKKKTFDLKYHGQYIMLAKGGIGGKGSISKKIKKNTYINIKGTKGEFLKLNLELKLLADVGLFGFPNIGKSTLINRISKSNFLTSDYPFTTLTPNLCVIKNLNNNNFTIADIPGLVNGSYKGSGLGHFFLRHLIRTRILIHIIDISIKKKEKKSNYQIFNNEKLMINEIYLYNENLRKRVRWIVINKIDLVNNLKSIKKNFSRYFKYKFPIFEVSAINKKGVKKLLFELKIYINSVK